MGAAPGTAEGITTASQPWRSIQLSVLWGFTRTCVVPGGKAPATAAEATAANAAALSSSVATAWQSQTVCEVQSAELNSRTLSGGGG